MSPTYFAVEAKRWETVQVIAALIIGEATKIGLKFKELEVMGDVELGTTKFFRFRSDLTDATALLDAIKERGLIRIVGTTCQVTFANGRKGTMPMDRMLMAPRMGQGIKYRGPGQPHADRQFS